MKKISALLLAVIILAGMLTGCKETADVNATVPETKKTTTATTTTTTQRTTENLNTTFREIQTAKIYPALKKTDGNYSFKLAEYTTYYDSSNKSRTKNIKNAVERLNNIKIPAGETFSFNQTVGKRTVTSGYEAAKVVEGDEFVDGLGGGICQVSSTVFQAALRSNLDITVRACHSLEISYVPLGSDATVQWNTQDFQFKNNTQSDIKMEVTAANSTLTCTIYSQKDIDTGNVKIKVKNNGKGAYTLTRTVDGKINYTTYSKYKKPKKTTTKKKQTETKKKKS